MTISRANSLGVRTHLKTREHTQRSAKLNLNNCVLYKVGIISLTHLAVYDGSSVIVLIFTLRRCVSWRCSLIETKVPNPGYIYLCSHLVSAPDVILGNVHKHQRQERDASEGGYMVSPLGPEHSDN